jgi:hypothetical protein
MTPEHIPNTFFAIALSEYHFAHHGREFIDERLQKRGDEIWQDGSSLGRLIIVSSLRSQTARDTRIMCFAPALCSAFLLKGTSTTPKCSAGHYHANELVMYGPDFVEYMRGARAFANVRDMNQLRLQISKEPT